MSDSPPHVLFLGAGLAGLVGARRLVDHGWRASLIDKGRGVGGRLATRRLDLPSGAVGRFDHGAQYFTARDAQFQQAVAAWTAAGVVRLWTDDFATDPLRQAARPASLEQHVHPRYFAPQGMNSLAKHLARGLDVRTGLRIVRLESVAGRWTAHAETGETFDADAVVLTFPVPQSLALVDASRIELPSDLRTALNQVDYAPCLALMVALDGPSRVPRPGGLFTGPEPIGWIADNSQKGVDSQPACVTLHAGPEFSRTHYDAPADKVIRTLLEAAAPWFGSKPVATALHRWRYSIPVSLYPERSAEWRPGDGGPLLFAGDAFGGARIEGAYLSGFDAAGRLLRANDS